MNKKQNYPKILLIFSMIIMFVFPYILQLEFVRKIVVQWLSFSDNPDYKIVYVQLIGSIIGVFLSVYSAMYLQKEQQKVDEEKQKKECLRNIYFELRICLRELQGIFRDTKLKYNLTEIEEKNVEKFCVTAMGTKLVLNENWVENLVGSGNIISGFDSNMIKKYYSQLRFIQRALESKNIDEIKKVFVPHICWFVASNGNGLHTDIEQFMERIDKISKE